MTSRSMLLKRAAVALTSAGVVLAGAVVLTGVSADAAIKKARTPFAYQGSAYGTRVTAGDPNSGGVASGRTAWAVLGCTDIAPVRHDKGSNVGKVNANDYIQVGAVDSFTSSYRLPKKKIYGSRSVNKVADITLGPADGPQLKIGALTTKAHAFNDHGRFRAGTKLSLVDLDAEGIAPEQAGPLHDLVDAIDAGKDQVATRVIEASGKDGITIPGLGTIYMAGKENKRTSSTLGMASAYGIRVKLDNGSRVDIGRAWARIQKAHPAGVFAGNAYGLEAVVGQGVVGLGRTPYQPLPCTGTEGEWRSNVLAEAPRNPQLNAGLLKAETYGKPNGDGSAVARARASVADLKLGGGALEIKGVVGQVNIFQDPEGNIVRRTLEGTSVRSIVANGQSQEIPDPGQTIEIPGVAKITASVQKELGARGLMVHALRVEMLDGSGLVLNLGTAQARINR